MVANSVFDAMSPPAGDGSPTAVMKTVRGRITAVHLGLDGFPDMTFDVKPLTSAGSTGSRGGVIENAIMLQPGFGNFERTDFAPTGLVYIPEVGSNVLCGFDGVRWAILGFLTGPFRDREGGDPESLGQTFNPGIEQVAPKWGEGLPKFALPWFYGVKPGDVIMGKGLARVKVTGLGVFVGASPSCIKIYKAEGDEVLERRAESELREVGHMQSHRFYPGATEQVQAWADQPEVVPPPRNGAVVDSRISEASPYVDTGEPFTIESVGHVTKSVREQARSRVDPDLEGAEVAAERNAAAGNPYTVVQRLLGALLTGTSGVPDAAEFTSKAYELWDHQVFSDGSFHIRAGNRTKAVGAEGHKSTNLDFDLSYDVTTQVFRLRVGPEDRPQAEFVLDGKKREFSLSAQQKGTIKVGDNTTIEASPDGVSVEAPKLSVRAPSMKLEGNVEVTGNVRASGVVTGGPTGTGLLTHTHIAPPLGGTTSPPTPGT